MKGLKSSICSHMCARIKMIKIITSKASKRHRMFCLGFFCGIILSLWEHWDSLCELFKKNCSQSYYHYHWNLSFSHTSFVSQHFSIFGFWRIFWEYEGKFWPSHSNMSQYSSWLSLQLGLWFQCGASKTCRTSACLRGITCHDRKETMSVAPAFVTDYMKNKSPQLLHFIDWLSVRQKSALVLLWAEKVVVSLIMYNSSGLAHIRYGIKLEII